MEKKIHKRKLFRLSGLILIAIFCFGIWKLSILWTNYFQNCLNPEFLSWDGDLRFVSTLHLLDKIRHFEFLSFIIQILDTPTWPFLRNLFQIPVFLAFKDPKFDVIISVLFYLFSFLYLLYYVWRIHKKSFRGIVLCLLIVLFLFQNQALVLYSFSSMLETQGAFFFLICLVHLYIFFQSPASKFPYGLLISFLGLYFTKYPYGYIFLAITLFVHFLRFFGEWKSLFFRYFKNHPSRNRIALYLSICFLILFLFIPKHLLIGKSATYLKYLIGFTFCLDFCIFYHFDKDLISKKLRTIFQIFLFPVLFWTFSHPDRFSSSGGTLKHIQSEGRQVGEEVVKNWEYYIYYLKVLFQEVWIYPISGWVFFGLFIILLGSGIYTFRIGKRISISSFVLIFLVCNLLGLTFLTPNHQARHVYHLIVVLILGVAISPIFRMKKISTAIISILFFSLGFFDIQEGKWKQSYLCFSGIGDIYQGPRFFQKLILEKVEKNAYLWNLMDENHLHRADSEYVFSLSMYEKNLRFYTLHRKFLKEWEEIPMIVTVARTCGILEKRNDPVLQNYQKRESYQGPEICAEIWETKIGYDR